MTRSDYRRDLDQLLPLMKSIGRYDAKHGRDMTEAIIWKPRTRPPWQDIPKSFALGKNSLAGSIDGLRKVFGQILSVYVARLIWNRLSPTEVTAALISMRD